MAAVRGRRCRHWVLLSRRAHWTTADRGCEVKNLDFTTEGGVRNTGVVRTYGQYCPIARGAEIFDIVEQLAMSRARRFIHGFRRENIAIELVETRPSARVAVAERLLADPDRVDNALGKLLIHGGARVDSADNAARGRSGWEQSYLARREHKLAQLERITRYAGSRGCRMVHLVAHFGDQEDDGRRCGRCDMCAPRDCVALRFRGPSTDERRALDRVLEALRRTDGQASGRLHRELFGAALPRDRFERLVGALVRAGHVFERVDSFEKDGRVIEFRRLFVSRPGRDANDLGGVPVAVESEVPPRRSRTAGPAASADLRVMVRAGSAHQRGPDPALAEALRAWRQAEARRLRVPAFCVLSNRTLEGIARSRPEDERALLRVKGVGHKVVERHGAPILALVRRCAAGQDPRGGPGRTDPNEPAPAT